MSSLSDDLLLSILYLLPAADLTCLGLASKALYCFVHTLDLWKALALQVHTSGLTAVLGHRLLEHSCSSCSASQLALGQLSTNVLLSADCMGDSAAAKQLSVLLQSIICSHAVRRSFQRTSVGVAVGVRHTCVTKHPDIKQAATNH